MQNRLSNVFSRAPRQGNGREGLTVADWSPVADITEDDKEYVVKAELPAIKKEDVKVTVENGVLTISGERKFEKEDKRYHRIERAYGSFVPQEAFWTEGPFWIDPFRPMIQPQGFETLREAERLEPLAATEEAAVCPERQPSSTGLLESSKPSMWKWCSVKLTESYPRSSASLACSLSSASMRS